MKLSIRSQLAYTCPEGPCTFVFNLESAHLGAQTIEHESLTLSPDLECDHYQETGLGNRYTRCHLPNGDDLTVQYEACLTVSHLSGLVADIGETSPDCLPLSVLPFTYPSRYCQSDRLMRMAHSEFGYLQPGFQRVLAICNWISTRVEYLSGTTDSETSAYDTATERQGVCRDFAHLGIALCRALGIPARFVSVYALALPTQDFHAIFEAYLDGRWWLFDPTRLVPLDAVVRIGTGRDAADVAFATFWGMTELTEQIISVQRLDGDASDWDGSPVSQVSAP